MKRSSLSLMVFLLLAAAFLAAVPASAVQSVEQSLDDTLTRGGRFTVTITGMPNTSYYIWLPGTFTMTGERYDQPPVIADNIEGVSKDSDGGPYTIGSYQYNNGNGRTILDEVAPSSATLSNTSYYAKVRTDATGQATVEFLTTVYTGTRSYSVRVENPDAPETTRLTVEINVQKRKAPTMAIYTASTTRAIPSATMTVVTAVPQPSAPQAMETTSTIEPSTTPVPAQVPTKRADPGPALCIAAAAAAVLACRARED